MKPRAIVAHNFASKEETDHIIELAKPLVSEGGTRGSARRCVRRAGRWKWAVVSRDPAARAGGCPKPPSPQASAFLSA